MGNKLLLEKIKNKMNESSISKLSRENHKLFNLANFIYSFDCNNDVNNPDVIFKYDRLCKKIDVVGILYTHYSLDLSKKVNEIRLSQDELERFALNLMFLATLRCDLKFIN